ncbi:hypothetical protein F4821DRAFT_230623 [Hypoxylon rubiginosum]|uniref:Uncharacterized protein n=1 Tax=Hypoxylon rubiginosum TaxID=110542 RepID=A0ACC0DAV8_9PEZI|nr:hypothetical protein F4821DRAFT_230623 [Hypoxylon rubiginosum]
MADTIDLEANLASNSPTGEESKGPQSTHEESNGDASGRGRIDGLLAKLVGIFKSQPEVIPSGPHVRYIIDNIFRSIDGSPNGHPRLGEFIGNEENHLIFRRFSFLQARVLLHLQDQLQMYEEELDFLDDHARRVHSTQGSDEVSRNRFALLQKIQEKYEKYIILMNHVTELARRGPPPDTHFKSLKNFFTNHEPPIYRYHLHKDDLVLLSPRGDTAEIDTRLTKFLLDAPNKLTRYIFTDREKSGRDEFMLVHNTRKVLIAKAVLLGLPLLLLLVGPIYPLYTLSRGEMTESTLVGIMFIQVGFTCVFACCLKYLTRPLRHELFACTVA